MKFTGNRVFLLLLGGALALGIAGGVALVGVFAASQVYAHGGYATNGDGTSFAAAIAQKLSQVLDGEVTEAQVQTAMNGVVADRQVANLEAKLDDLGAEDDARSAILEWFDDYPYSDLIRLRTIGLASSDRVGGYLERLVNAGHVTQEQADGIQAWYDQRPALPEGLERSGYGRHGKRGDGAGSSFRGRHHGGGDGAGSFFRGRFHRGGETSFSGNPL